MIVIKEKDGKAEYRENVIIDNPYVMNVEGKIYLPFGGGWFVDKSHKEFVKWYNKKYA